MPELEKLMETYSNCLELGREYFNSMTAKEDDVDLDCLQQFLEIRSDLVATAENSLAGLDNKAEDAESSPQRRELTGKIISILEEITELEASLTSHLSGQLGKMRATIDQMHKTQPVFRRYSHLGGPPHPSRINRHE